MTDSAVVTAAPIVTTFIVISAIIASVTITSFLQYKNINVFICFDGLTIIWPLDG
jgi:hypothetical protein